MRTASTGFKSHLAPTGLTGTTLAHLVQIIRRDTVVVRLTDAVTNIIFGSDVWEASPGVLFESLTIPSDGSPSSINLTIGVGGSVTTEEIKAGFYDGAEVELFVIDYAFPDDVMQLGGRFKVGPILHGDDDTAIGLGIVALSEVLDEFMPRIITVTCGWQLGDSRCGVDLFAHGFTRTATVSLVTSRLKFRITVTEPRAVNGWYDNGALQFSAGANDGLSFDVRKWTRIGNIVELWEPAYADIQVGDTLQIHPGCDYTIGASGHAKFHASAATFGGFPFMTEKVFDAAVHSEPATKVDTVQLPGSDAQYGTVVLG